MEQKYVSNSPTEAIFEVIGMPLSTTATVSAVKFYDATGNIDATEHAKIETISIEPMFYALSKAVDGTMSSSGGGFSVIGAGFDVMTADLKVVNKVLETETCTSVKIVRYGLLHCELAPGLIEVANEALTLTRAGGSAIDCTTKTDFKCTLKTAVAAGTYAGISGVTYADSKITFAGE